MVEKNSKAGGWDNWELSFYMKTRLMIAFCPQSINFLPLALCGTCNTKLDKIFYVTIRDTITSLDPSILPTTMHLL